MTVENFLGPLSSYGQDLAMAREQEMTGKYSNSRSGFREWAIFGRGWLGIIVIVMAIMAAGVIARSTDKSSLYWVARTEIAQGDRIRQEQVALARLYLPGRSEFYIPSTQSVIGAIAREGIRSGEALAQSEITERPDGLLWRLISLDIGESDLPEGAMKGKLIDIYGLDEEDPLGARLVMESVVIDAIVDGGGMSDRIEVVVRVQLAQVRPLLEAYARARLALVLQVDS